MVLVLYWYAPDIVYDCRMWGTGVLQLTEAAGAKCADLYMEKWCGLKSGRHKIYW